MFVENDFKGFLIGGAAAFAGWIPDLAGMMGWVEILGIASWESVGWGAKTRWGAADSHPSLLP